MQDSDSDTSFCFIHDPKVTADAWAKSNAANVHNDFLLEGLRSGGGRDDWAWRLCGNDQAALGVGAIAA